MDKTCPFCQSTELTAAESVAEFNDRRKKQLLTVRLVHTECGNCEREFTTHAQGLENTVRIDAARRAAGGAPTADEIIEMREEMNLNQAEAGALFGGGPVAFSKYENDAIVPAQSMARLLSLAVARVISRLDLEQAANGTLTKRSKETVALSTVTDSQPMEMDAHSVPQIETHVLTVAENDQLSVPEFIAWTDQNIGGDLSARSEYIVIMNIHRTVPNPEKILSPLLMEATQLNSWTGFFKPRAKSEVPQHAG